MEYPHISPAKTSDIESILEIMRENLHHYHNPGNLQDLEKTGFLVYPFSSEEIHQCIISPESHIVLTAKTVQQIVCGYLLGYDLKTWKKLKPEWDTTPYKVKGNTFYLRHVAIKKGSNRTGIKLETELFRQALKKGYKFIIGEIMTSPIQNKRSLSFHEKLGFETIGALQYDDGTTWDLLQKKL